MTCQKLITSPDSLIMASTNGAPCITVGVDALVSDQVFYATPPDELRSGNVQFLWQQSGLNTTPQPLPTQSQLLDPNPAPIDGGGPVSASGASAAMVWTPTTDIVGLANPARGWLWAIVSTDASLDCPPDTFSTRAGRGVYQHSCPSYQAASVAPRAAEASAVDSITVGFVIGNHTRGFSRAELVVRTIEARGLAPLATSVRAKPLELGAGQPVFAGLVPDEHPLAQEGNEGRREREHRLMIEQGRSYQCFVTTFFTDKNDIRAVVQADLRVLKGRNPGFLIDTMLLDLESPRQRRNAENLEGSAILDGNIAPKEVRYAEMGTRALIPFALAAGLCSDKPVARRAMFGSLIVAVGGSIGRRV
jgi:hypothetical protein